MSKTDDYIIDKHNEELEQNQKEKEKSELKEFKRRELEWELRFDIWD